MELITLIMLIIVCGIGILLAFRIITFVLRIISVVILLIAIILVAGSYFSAQAYILPTAHSSFITIANDGNFVMTKTSTTQYQLDTVATAAVARQFLKPIKVIDSATYTQFKSFAQTDIFADSDTVWVINAINKSGCAQDRVTTATSSTSLNSASIFQQSCIDAPQTAQQQSQTTQDIQNTAQQIPAVAKTLNFFERIANFVDASALNRIPVKANFMQWVRNYYFS